MSKGLKGITVKIDGDTTPLNQALSKVNSETKSLQGELKGVNSLLKFDPKNTELLAHKQSILRQSIEQTESKLKTLTIAQQQMAEAGKNADNSAEYRDLQREIAATEHKLEELRKQRSVFDVLKQGVKDFTKTIGEAAMMSPKINKLVTGFQNVKQKIKETVKESTAVQKIGSAVEGARQKVEAFKDAHPKVMKVAEAFGKVKDAAAELKSKLPTLQQSLAAVGKAAAGAAKGGFKALEVTIGGTMKAFAAFSTAALTAGAAIAKNALEQYADYEQLAGGVETLFGAGGQSLEEYAESVGKTTQDAQKEYDSLMMAQETVLKNADNAYRTAGLSANEYMDTVTGFSAALIRSLGGDTEAAAEKADMAITDMADNANKMGSDISSIQNAYQGFAKQNYTMLDNLKLGYGGTKEEMQRLLDDATKLSGVEYDISSYADIVDAIHVVQTEMGITGTTAEEASETISGSVNAAKSAWKNLMTGLADENADLDGLIDNMADSVLTVVDNVLPRVMETVPRIVEAVPKLIEKLGAAFEGIAGQLGGLAEQLLPPLIQAFFTLVRTVTGALPTLLPKITNAAIKLFGGLLEGLKETIPQLAAMLPSLIQTITQTLTTNLPEIIAAGIQILVSLIDGITGAIPSLTDAILDLFPVIVQTILDNLPLIIEAGLNLLLALTEGIAGAIPQLVAMLPEIIQAIITTIGGMLPQIIETGVTVLKTLISGITQAIPQLVDALPEIIQAIIMTIADNFPLIIQSGIELIGALISGLIQAVPSLVAAIPKIITSIFDAFVSVDWGEIGRNIIDGISAGIEGAADKLLGALQGVSTGALDAVKEELGIHSPSTVMRDQVGKMIPAGIAEGVEEGMAQEESRIRAAMQRGVPTTIDSYIKRSKGRQEVSGAMGTAGGFVQYVTINSPTPLSPYETARRIRNTTRQVISQLKPT